MYEKNRSGQWLYFGMVSALSGNAVPSIASGNISGRVSLDGGAQAVCAGPINEVGGGQYVLGMYAGDINAQIAGFYFTASGCVPVSFTAITSENVSGRLSPVSGLAVGLLSGQSVIVNSGQLSGQPVTAASGAFVFASLNSGQPTLTYSGQLSGQPLTLLSGRTWLASGGIASGTVYLASGRQNPTSGLVYLGSGSYVHTNAAYVEGNVWYNAASTNANSTYPYDGTAYNAVNTWARALTVLGQMPQPSRGVFSMNGSQVTLLSGLFGFRLDGDSWTFAPGGFGLASTVVTHGFVSGTVAASTSGNPPVFDTCPMGLVTLPPSVLIGCGLQQSLTLNGSGGYTLVNCFSEAQGAAGATIDLVSGTGIHSLKIRNWQGGLTLQNITSGDIVTIDGNGALTVDPTCVGGTLRVRGNFMFTNSGQILALNEAARFGSGNVYLASGSLSGQPVIATVGSGLFVVASLNSGQEVLVYSGQLSGQPVDATAIVGSGISVIATLYSGQFAIPYSGSLSGQKVELFSGNTVTALSGAFTVASLNSGQFTIPYSGQMSGQLVRAASGAFATASLNSGQEVLVYSGQLSGQQVTARTVTDKSGYTAGLISGANFIASGHSTVSTLYSGQPVLVYSGQLSGQPVDATAIVGSGISVVATLYSGQQVLVYSGQLSGQPLTATVGSGLFVTASLNSGQQVLVYSGQLSGQPTSPNSGAFVNASLNSGQQVRVSSGQLSGQFMTPQSGTVFLGSGQMSVQIPQAVLTYDFSGSPDVSGVRCLLNAERKLINRWSLNAVSGYLRVYKEDDSTVAYDQAVTSTSGAQPITSLDT